MHVLALKLYITYSLAAACYVVFSSFFTLITMAGIWHLLLAISVTVGVHVSHKIINLDDRLSHRHSHSPCWVSHHVASIKGVDGSGWVKYASIPREDGHPTIEQHFTLRGEMNKTKLYSQKKMSAYHLL